MQLSIQTLLTASAALAAAGALLGAYNRAYRWYRKQEAQDRAIRQIKDEQSLLTCGVLACLKGLKEQGCNGPVTEAIATIEKHLNQQAHQ